MEHRRPGRSATWRPAPPASPCSTGAVGPAMPALFTSTSSPPRCATAASTNASQSAGSPASARMPRMAARVQRRGIDVGDEHRRAAGREAVGHHPADAVGPGADRHPQAGQIDRQRHARAGHHGNFPRSAARHRARGSRKADRLNPFRTRGRPLDVRPDGTRAAATPIVPAATAPEPALAVAELIAVLAAVTDGVPRVLTLADGGALPSGPLEPGTGRCRPGCAPGWNARPIIRWDMSSSSTRSPTRTARFRAGGISRSAIWA